MAKAMCTPDGTLIIIYISTPSSEGPDPRNHIDSSKENHEVSDPVLASNQSEIYIKH